MAQNPASMEAHKNWLAASEKYDYFVLGLNGALCAWIVQTLQFKEVVPATAMQLLGLALLVLSAIFGMKRIETAVNIHGLTLQKTSAQEGLERRLIVAREEYEALGPHTNSAIEKLNKIDLHIQEIAAAIDTRRALAKRFYAARDLLLWGGFVSYSLGRVLALLQAVN